MQNHKSRIVVKEATEVRVRKRKQKTLNPLMMAKDVVDVFVMEITFKLKELIMETTKETVVKAKLDKTMIGLDTYLMIE